MQGYNLQINILDARGQFHQHIYVQLLQVQIPKAQKDSQVINVILHFWDLREQNLLVKPSWNRPQMR